MESTEMLKALQEIKASISEPLSHMEIIRRSLRRQASALTTPQMPSLLTGEQREVFMAHIDRVQAFLESEDGADALELLVTSFREFVSRPAPDTASAE